MSKDSIRRFSKSKGYESIPRELLQSKELTLEAIGLLCNMTSYPDTWILHKTELRKRFVNKEKVVDRIWDELVQTGYIIQFRKRVGRSYTYQYFFNVEKFTLEEVQEMCDMMHQEEFVLYHKAMLKIKEEIIPYKDFIYISEEDKEKLDLSYWTSQNGNLTKEDEINDSWGSQNGKSNMECPKQEGNRLTIKRLTNKMSHTTPTPKNDDDDNNIKQENGILEKLTRLVRENSDYRNLALTLRGADVSIDNVYEIIEYFETNKGSFDKELVKQQLEWMQMKSTTDVGISDFGIYFIGGYKQRAETKNINSISSNEFDSLLGIDSELPHVPLYNWLEGE